MRLDHRAVLARPSTEHVRWRDANPQVPVLDLAFREEIRKAFPAYIERFSRYL